MKAAKLFFIVFICLMTVSCSGIGITGKTSAGSTGDITNTNPAPVGSTQTDQGSEELTDTFGETSEPLRIETPEDMGEDGVYKKLVMDIPVPERIIPGPATQRIYEFNDGYDDLRNSVPAMDGSTSLIPFEAALRSALLDIPFEEAKKAVVHSSTWGSFSNLMMGYSDAIFSCPLSEDQRRRLSFYEGQHGAKLREVPVTMEAFVFVVNAENPVKTLTQEQIRDIYSGKITNWKEVGGRDAEIIAYQRNEDSGSQNYMKEFMKGYDLVDAPTVLRPFVMGMLMDAVALNDNSIDSIGYSVYAYAADMYESSDKVSFIAVDGVKPGRDTISDGSYPLLGYNYLMYFENNEAGKLLESFALSEKAQLAAAKAGYVPVTRLDFDYDTKLYALYRGIGSGAASNDDWLSPFSYVTPIVDQVGEYPGSTDADFGRILSKTTRQSVFEHAKSAAERMLNEYRDFYEIAGYQKNNPPVELRMKQKNGYLILTVTLSSANTGIYDADCSVWDLESGRRLEKEEIFCAGTEIDVFLNDLVRRRITTEWLSEGKTDFLGLTNEDWWTVTDEALYVKYDNPYFYEGEIFLFPMEADRLVVTSRIRDYSEWYVNPDSKGDLIKDLVPRLNVSEFDEGQRGSLDYDAFAADSFYYPKLTPAYPNARKINEAIRAFMTDNFKDVGSPPYFGWEGILLGNRYLIVQNTRFGTDFEGEPFELPEKTVKKLKTLIFDLKTGESVSLKDIVSGDYSDRLEGFRYFRAYVNSWETSEENVVITEFRPGAYDSEDYESRITKTERIPVSALIF